MLRTRVDHLPVQHCDESVLVHVRVPLRDEEELVVVVEVASPRPALRLAADGIGAREVLSSEHPVLQTVHVVSRLERRREERPRHTLFLQFSLRQHGPTYEELVHVHDLDLVAVAVQPDLAHHVSQTDLLVPEHADRDELAEEEEGECDGEGVVD